MGPPVLLLAAFALWSVCATAPAATDPVAGTVVSAAFGPDGRLWRVTPHEWNLGVDVSADLGRSFSTPVLIQAGKQRLRVDPEGRPQIAVDGQGHLYVAWTADARKANQTFVAYSVDGGRTFSPPVTPGGPAPPAPQLRPFLLAGADSAELYFLGPGAGSRGQGTPRAATLYGANVRPGAIPPMASSALADAACECCRLDADFGQDGAPRILSRMVFPGEVRDFGIIQPPAGGRPATVRRVTEDGWRIDACPEHGGALSIGPDGRQHLAWFTQGARRQGLFYAWSDDSGAGFSAPVPMGDPAALPGHADVLAKDGSAYLVWQQFDGRRTSILTAVSRDNGSAWSAPRELASTDGAADYPFLRTDGHGVYVSWYTANQGYRLFPLEAAAGAAPQAAMRAFGPGAFRQLLAARSHEPFLLNLWSVDCAPCLKELRMMGEMRKAGVDLPLVLVATDDRSREAEVLEIIGRFGLLDVENWIFAGDNPAALRYGIDPRWYGEMPRSYFYDGAGGRSAVSGGLTAEQFTRWLKELPLGQARTGPAP